MCVHDTSDYFVPVFYSGRSVEFFCVCVCEEPVLSSREEGVKCFQTLSIFFLIAIKLETFVWSVVLPTGLSNEENLEDGDSWGISAH